MALKKPAAPAAAGKFEDPAESGTATAVAEAPAPQAAPNAAESAVAAAGVKASTAVARISANSLAAAIKTESVLAQLRDAIPPVQFGTFPRLIGSNGNVMDKDGKVLGQFADIQLLSWSETYVVSPGSDTDEAKKLVRYSRDGVTIDETGEDVNAYLKTLREVEKYPDASKKKYIELVGFLTASDKPSEHAGNLVQVSLSPQSLLSFQAYMANVAVRVRLGSLVADGVENLRITPEVKTKGSKSFTLLKVAGQK